MQRRLRVTTLYVTHDQTEAMTLGDRVVVINRGRIQQVDTPLGVYERPANTFVAGFIGTPPMNLVAARYDAGVLSIASQRVTLPHTVTERLGRGPHELTVGVRPEAFVSEYAGANALFAVPEPATVEMLGSETLVRATLASEAVTVRLIGVVRGLPERVAAPPEALHLFSAESGQRVGWP